MRLRLLQGRVAVCRLDPGERIPVWAFSAGGFASITRAAGGFSVVCAENAVPPGTTCECGWRVFQVEGPLDFDLTGILASIAQPLAEAGVSIFAVSTYDTDYVLVKEETVPAAARALTAAGHQVTGAPTS